MRTNLGKKSGNPDTDGARRLSRLESAIQQIPSRFGGAQPASTYVFGYISGSASMSAGSTKTLAFSAGTVISRFPGTAPTRNGFDAGYSIWSYPYFDERLCLYSTQGVVQVSVTAGGGFAGGKLALTVRARPTATALANDVYHGGVGPSAWSGSLATYALPSGAGTYNFSAYINAIAQYIHGPADTVQFDYLFDTAGSDASVIALGATGQLISAEGVISVPGR